MIIEFYNKESGEVIGEDLSADYYFVMNNVVYCDNQFSTESQESSVYFTDFITKCRCIGWRVVG